MHKDVTVYAVAGDTKTILAVAEKNGIHIPFDCRDGNCGSCLIEVTYLSGKPKMAVDLTEKEKGTLLSIGKITHEQIDHAENAHMPPKYRLACQYIARDEDIHVKFTGEPGGSN
jgi:ferredoxin